MATWPPSIHVFCTFPDPSTEVIDAFHSIVGAIILVKIPLSRSSLARLLSIDNSMLDFICKGLRSILDASDVLRFSHQSSVDYLVDSRSCPALFLIKLEDQNQKLAESCLRVMRSELQFNIGNIPSSHLWNNDIVDLSTRIELAISPQLSYSCCFVADHVHECPYQQSIADNLHDFVAESFLYWLEVLSLIKQMDIASEKLLLMIEWMNVRFLPLSTFAMGLKYFVDAWRRHSIIERCKEVCDSLYGRYLP